MSSSARSRREIPSLTGIRAFAAWWVVLFHLEPQLKALFPGIAPYLWIIQHGDRGVDLFFVLSGFVLAYNYADRFRVSLSHSEYGRFLWLRLARIYPVHLLGLLTWGLLFIGSVSFLHKREFNGCYDCFGERKLVANLFLVQSWTVPIKLSWNYPAWTISMEWLAYLVFPFVVPMLVSLRPLRAALIIAVLLLLAPYGMTTQFEHFVRIGVGFSVGCLLFGLWDKKPLQNPKLAPWMPAISLAFSWALIPILVTSTRFRFVTLPVFTASIYCLASASDFSGGVLSSPLATYLGRISYSQYIMHAAVLAVLSAVLPSSHFTHSELLVSCAVLALYVVGVLLVSIATYHLLEEPARHWMRSLKNLQPKSLVPPRVWLLKLHKSE